MTVVLRFLWVGDQTDGVSYKFRWIEDPVETDPSPTVSYLVSFGSLDLYVLTRMLQNERGTNLCFTRGRGDVRGGGR